jgi:hypothetical protein
MLSLVFISVVGLALAWRWERLGGWLSLVTLAVLSILFLIIVERSFPALLIILVGIGVPSEGELRFDGSDLGEGNLVAVEGQLKGIKLAGEGWCFPSELVLGAII